jgi:hypothetical protein
MSCNGIQTGSGTNVMIGAVRPDCLEPTPFVATVDTAALSGATSLVLDADLPIGAYLTDGWNLTLVTPSGAEILAVVDGVVNVTAAGAATLTVEALPSAVPVGTTIAYPQVLKGRETAGITATIGRSTSVQLEDKGATSGVTHSSDTAIELGGNYLVDAANINFRDAALGTETTAPRDIYMWIIDPAPNELFTFGETVKGQVNPTNWSKMISSTDITKGALGAAFNGKPTFIKAGSTVNGYFGIAGITG